MFIPSVVYAACTGCDTLSASCDTASTSAAQIQTCLDTSPEAGKTVTLNAGSATWTTTITIDKSAYLIGNGIGSTVITTSGSPGIYVNLNPTDASDNIPVRVSGFTLRHSGYMMLRYNNQSNIYPSTKVRFDHLGFEAGGSGQYTFVFSGLAHGVMDHCTTDGYTFMGLEGGHTSVWAGTTAESAFEYGTLNNFYFEDNVFTGYATTDGNGTGRYAFRYNKYDHCVMGGWLDQHGDHGGQGSGMGAEIYGNLLIADTGVCGGANPRCGKWLFYYNKLTHSGGGGFNPYIAYFGEEQQDSSIPPAVHAYNGQTHHINNSYLWNNKDNGVELNGVLWTAGSHLVCDTCNEDVPQNNMHYWNYVASPATPMINGTGCGTLANRPATCTPLTPGGTYGARESATGQYRGPAYWVPNPAIDPTASTCSDASSLSGPDNVLAASVGGNTGTLYKCTATNTWTAYYTPLAYPHPLQGEAAIPPSIQGCTISGGTFK